MTPIGTKFFIIFLLIIQPEHQAIIMKPSLVEMFEKPNSSVASWRALQEHF